jgi:hypothetical protein
LQCPDKDELAAVMKLLEEHRGDFWPDFIAVTLMAGARRGALCLRVRASGLRGGAVREARLAGMFDDTPPTAPGRIQRHCVAALALAAVQRLA